MTIEKRDALGPSPATSAVNAVPDGFSINFDISALCVVDMQNDFLSEGGYMNARGRDVNALRTAVRPTRQLIDWAHDNEIPVVFTRQGHRADLADLPSRKAQRAARDGIPIGSPGINGRHFIRGEWGNHIVDELTPSANDIVVDKPANGAFYGSDFDLILRVLGVSSLIVCGVTTSSCVNSIVREASDRGFSCLVAADACASFDEELHALSLEILSRSSGIFAHVAQASDIVKVTNR